MVTGRRAFEGKTTASTIAAILAAEPPPISTLQPLSPPALEGTVKNCLAKDPDERLQTAHDVKLQLKWIKENSSSSAMTAASPERRSPWDRVGWLVAGLLLLLLLGAASAWWLRARATPAAMYFNSPAPFPAAYLRYRRMGKRSRWSHIRIKRTRMSSGSTTWEARARPCCREPRAPFYPFWSPDGRSARILCPG